MLVMTIPLVVLAVLAFAGGFIGIPAVFSEHGDRLGAFLAPVIAPHEGEAVSHSLELTLMALSTVLVLVMIVLAWMMYRNYREKATTGFGKILENKWYVDELYDAVIVKPLNALAGFLKSFVEKYVIDGLVNGVGRVVQYGSRQLRLLQSGQVGVYVLLMVLSMLLIFAIQFFIRK